MKTTVRRLLALVLVFALSLTMAPGVFAATKVAINSTNFPDEVFRSYVSDNFDTDGDGYLSDSEIAAAERIKITNRGVSSLKGIGYLTSLKSLYCNNNDLSELDVSKNTNLVELSCINNNLSSLDVSNNTKLEWLNCDSNKLSVLDVSKNVRLTSLHCEWNELTKLDLSKNADLELLDCGWNDLGSLDVSKNTKLVQLYCIYTDLSSLDVSNNPELEILHCSCNSLNKLDISKNTKLTELRCNNNDLSSLDVSRNLELTGLDLCFNSISSIDVSKHTKLEYLWFSYNNVSSIDISKNAVLQQVECDHNKMTELDVSRNPYLYNINCGDNNISSLDVSNNPNLTILACYNNNLTELDITGCQYIYMLLCKGNSIEELDISGCPDLLKAYNDGEEYSSSYGYYKYTGLLYSDDEGAWDILSVDSSTEILTEPAGFGIKSLTNGDTTGGITVKLSGTGGYSKLRIQRKAGSGSWTTLTSDVTGSNYTDTKANVGGTTYSYRVAGYADGAWTDYSEAVSIVRNPFKDVKDTASYFKALMWAYNNNIVAGTSTTAFSPNANCTRGQFALMLWRMNGKPSIKGMSIPFTDVPSTNGFYKGIVWCYNKGITAGTSATTYSPNDNIKRWQMILMFWRMQNKPASSLTENPFTDVKTTASYYKAALWAYEKGITGVKQFKPNDLCTRWQLVLFLYRLNNLYHYI